MATAREPKDLVGEYCREVGNLDYDCHYDTMNMSWRFRIKCRLTSKVYGFEIRHRSFLEKADMDETERWIKITDKLLMQERGIWASTYFKTSKLAAKNPEFYVYSDKIKWYTPEAKSSNPLKEQPKAEKKKDERYEENGDYGIF